MAVRWRARCQTRTLASGVLPPPDYVIGGTRVNRPPERFPIKCGTCGKEDTIPFQPKPNTQYDCRSCHYEKKLRQNE